MGLPDWYQPLPIVREVEVNTGTVFAIGITEVNAVPLTGNYIIRWCELWMKEGVGDTIDLSNTVRIYIDGNSCVEYTLTEVLTMDGAADWAQYKPFYNDNNIVKVRLMPELRCNSSFYVKYKHLTVGQTTGCTWVIIADKLL